MKTLMLLTCCTLLALWAVRAEGMASSRSERGAIGTPKGQGTVHKAPSRARSALLSFGSEQEILAASQDPQRTAEERARFWYLYVLRAFDWADPGQSLGGCAFEPSSVSSLNGFFVKADYFVPSHGDSSLPPQDGMVHGLWLASGEDSVKINIGVFANGYLAAEQLVNWAGLSLGLAMPWPFYHFGQPLGFSIGDACLLDSTDASQVRRAGFYRNNVAVWIDCTMADGSVGSAIEILSAVDTCAQAQALPDTVWDTHPHLPELQNVTASCSELYLANPHFPEDYAQLSYLPFDPQGLPTKVVGAATTTCGDLQLNATTSPTEVRPGNPGQCSLTLVVVNSAGLWHSVVLAFEVRERD